MKPWKISVGVTVSGAGVVVLWLGKRFEFLAPHGRLVIAKYWLPVAVYGGIALVTAAVLVAVVARRVLLLDTGRKVGLVERSLRQGDGDPEFIRRLEAETRGEFAD